MAGRKSLKILRKARVVRQTRCTGGLKVDRLDNFLLDKKRSTYDENLTETLTNVLEEWMARNPGRVVDDASLIAILPEALDEFIWRHFEDFR